MSRWLIILILGTLFVAQGLAMSWDSSRSEVSTSNNEFAFDMYQVVTTDTDANIFFSPYSISQAGAMLYGGARNQTATQIADAFNYTLNADELAANYASMNESLNNQGTDLPPEMAEGKFQLNVVNSVWAQQGFSFSTDYLATLQDDFGSELQQADFENNANSARLDINDWISEQTAERLQDVVPEDAINQDTRMVLVNAIYFNALWQTPFLEDNTYNADFTLLGGENASVPMMRQNVVYHNYVEGENYVAVALPYLGSSIEMVVIVPDDLAEFEASLDATQFNVIRQAMNITYLDVEMPRFEFKADIPLKDALKTMGMVDAFDPYQADLTGMTTDDTMQRLFVSNAIHSAFVGVDEKGTEAAAVTVFSVSIESASVDQPTLFRADQSFIFAIYDTEINLVLFLGRVTNPNQ